MLRYGFWLLIGLIIPAFSNLVATAASRPNIIVILADDMGYSDLGCYGAEIDTPNLDRLGMQGVRFSRFYNAARCCPTRASLLTGVHPHQAGIGGMTDIDASIPEYQGYLNNRVMTMAELLKQAGYATYLSGKWHVGEEQAAWPHNRGFDRTFANISGLGSYFDFHPVWNEKWPPGNEVIITVDGKRLTTGESDFYVTDLFTDKAIEFIEAHNRRKPFFLYLGYTAPHWPLHALEEDIPKYERIYRFGWDTTRQARLDKLKGLGLLDKTTENPERDPLVPEWSSLSAEDRQTNTRLMAVHAAMVSRMDWNIGRLIELLEKKQSLSNTAIFFLSDNGAARTGNMAGGEYMHSRFRADALAGTPESMTGMGRGWAQVSNTPYREYKASTYEGGMVTPFIAWFPAAFQPSLIKDEVGHIIDVMPTLAELSGARYPAQHKGRLLIPLQGRSLVPVLSGNRQSGQRKLNWEHNGNRAAMSGPWKLVGPRNKDWELYNLEDDPIESQDLSQSYPEKAGELRRQYETWAARVGVRTVEEVKAASPYTF